MGNSSSTAGAEAAGTTAAVSIAVRAVTDGEKKPPCKPCCACPETKRARDACIVENGEESCKDLIEAHRVCMRQLGFNI